MSGKLDAANPLPEMSGLEIQEAVTHVKQSGTTSRVEILTRIPHSTVNTLRSLNLQYLDIHTPLLLQILRKSTCLQVLFILNCRLSETLTERVTLPNLTDFTLGLNITSIPNVQEIDPLKFHSLVFFDKKGKWEIENIWLLNINIELIINHDIIFKVHHQRSVFLSKLTFTNKISEFLDWEETNVQRLFKLFCEIDLDLIPENLIQLSLSDTKVNASDIPSILERCTRIEILKLHFSEVTQIQLASIFGLEALRELCLSNVEINYVPLVFNLKTLNLENCTFCPKTLAMFSRVFKAEQLRLVWPTVSTRHETVNRLKLLETLSQNIATTSICIRNMGIWNWERCHRVMGENYNCNLNCGDVCKTVHTEMMLYCDKFVLQSNSSPSFIIERKHKWVAKDLNFDEQTIIEKSIIATFQPW